ncbi:hypothetical protein HQ576_07355, partial [bacterium]|nr:hypothetical protein [bacterium]
MRGKQVWTMVWTLVVCLAGVGVGSASANTFTIGQNLTNRALLDGGTGYLFAAESFGFREGTVDQWAVRSNAGGWGG